MRRGAASVIGDAASTVEINLEDKILAREVITLMMPSIESYLGEQSRQLRIVAMQGMGIVFLGSFSGMVTGLDLSPPQQTNIPKVIYGSLFGGLVGISVALTLILKITREFIIHESD